MTDPFAHLPEMLRIAMRRQPRRAANSPSPTRSARAPSREGRGDAPPVQNNYLAEAPKNPIGARPGNRNAVTHGAHAVDSRARRAALAELLRDLKARAVAAAESLLERRDV